jgi:putative peptide zinc metalloprotease protein
MFAPVPLHTTTEGVVWLPEHAHVRARADGFVVRLQSRPGQEVSAGSPLLEMEEPSVETQVNVLTERVAELEVRLIAERFTDRVAAEITRMELDKERAALERELERLRRLSLQATAPGTFIVPQAEDLIGRFIHEGEIVGYVLPSSTGIARAIVGQDDIDLVRNRLRGIEVKLSDRLGETFHATVLSEVPAALDQLPSRALGFAGGGAIAADPRDPKGTKALQRFFNLDLSLDPTPERIWFGTRVYVRFEHEWEPLWSQIYRRVRQLFLAQFSV